MVREGSPREAFKVSLGLQVRFADTDAMGHVNNAVYLSYFELARMEYWRRLTGLEDFSKIDIILARAEVDYRSPAKLGDRLEVLVRVSGVRRSSFEMEYRVEESRSGRLVAEGRSVQVFFDYAKDRVKRVDPAVLERIAEIEGEGP